VSGGAYGINDLDLADSLVSRVAALDPGSVEVLRYQLQLAYQRGGRVAMGRGYTRLEGAVGPLAREMWYLYRLGSASMRSVLDTT